MNEGNAEASGSGSWGGASMPQPRFLPSTNEARLGWPQRTYDTPADESPFAGLYPDFAMKVAQTSDEVEEEEEELERVVSDSLSLMRKTFLARIAMLQAGSHGARRSRCTPHASLPVSSQVAAPGAPKVVKAATPWTPEEDAIIWLNLDRRRKGVKVTNRMITEQVGGRTEKAVGHRISAMNSISSSQVLLKVSKPWSPEEDAIIWLGLDKRRLGGIVSNNDITDGLPGRTAKSVSLRVTHLNNLRPFGGVESTATQPQGSARAPPPVSVPPRPQDLATVPPPAPRVPTPSVASASASVLALQKPKLPVRNFPAGSSAASWFETGKFKPTATISVGVPTASSSSLPNGTTKPAVDPPLFGSSTQSSAPNTQSKATTAISKPVIPTLFVEPWTSSASIGTIEAKPVANAGPPEPHPSSCVPKSKVASSSLSAGPSALQKGKFKPATNLFPFGSPASSTASKLFSKALQGPTPPESELGDKPIARQGNISKSITKHTLPKVVGPFSVIPKATPSNIVSSSTSSSSSHSITTTKSKLDPTKATSPSSKGKKGFAVVVPPRHSLSRSPSVTKCRANSPEPSRRAEKSKPTLQKEVASQNLKKRESMSCEALDRSSKKKKVEV
ncbi:hypothetical protein P7C70_g2327, partial [Phenoliferia sp. Uapishka_3]